MSLQHLLCIFYFVGKPSLSQQYSILSRDLIVRICLSFQKCRGFDSRQDQHGRIWNGVRLHRLRVRASQKSLEIWSTIQVCNLCISMTTKSYADKEQWGPEIQMCPDFEWSKKAWFANVPNFKWNLKFGSPTI